ncbi:D-alanine--D-alanine ligase [bacterium]|nr:D-alanine--D-alanine ligase [Akkermansiaceae bacterium]MDB4585125.1 D-alanine--D-alanine ligase [bacterium]MDB4691973.1 D-alanine--D-alanine ligase [Akkermansiaceae bacterium]MDB4800500.1 D-alanine--D-alanine ligase [bacterium]
MSLDKEMVIAVLMGGPGAEREVSMASGKAVLKAMLDQGYNAVGVEVSDESPELPENVGLAFNVIHGTFGEDGGLQKFLGAKGIPYTGAGEETSRVAFDKVLSKEVFVKHGVPTPLSETIDCTDGAKLPEMAAPFVVKPPREGSSVGIRVVKDQAEAMAAMEHGAKFSPDILVEQFVEGRELTVGVIGGEILPVVEIIPPDGEWYDMETKYPWLSGKTGGSQYVCPANLTPAELAAVNDAAKKAYDALGIEVYSRVDVLLNSSGNPYVLEANTIPGMTETSLLPMAGTEAGYSFGELCVKIAELSLEERG